MQAPVGLIGASGYSGIEATRLLAHHPGLLLRFATSDRWVGQPLSARLTDLTGPAASLRYVSNDEGLDHAGDCAVVLLATPAESSLGLVPRLLQRSVKVIDLSGAFRLKDAALYPRFYGFVHSAAMLLSEAVYGLPELQREQVRGARLVANPGCYATAAALALAPLLQAGLLEAGAVITDAASGVSGAGRKASEEFSFCEVADDFHPYKTLRHQHAPEIQQTLGLAEPGRPLRPLTFTPHLLPVRRGIVATSYGRLRNGATAKDVASAMRAFAAREPMFVYAPSADAVALRDVVGTAQVRVGASVDEEGLDPGRLVVTSALDNLLKGAASQAVQNLNLILGLNETAGLERLRPFIP
jgi:N-acetyl-gamma-glutamyl-phosphate reductase